MSFNGAVKEKIARTIGEFFTTNQIVNVFDDANIPTERELFAKWRIILDAFSKMSDPEAAIPHILSVFCHPLHFPDPQIRSNFIEKLNTILAYENLKIQATSKGAEILTADGFQIDAPPPETKKPVEAESEPKPKIYQNKETPEKPKRIKPELKTSQYLSDDLLFLIWRILKIDNQPSHWEFMFMHIQPVGWANTKTIGYLFDLESQFGIRFQNPRFDLHYFKETYDYGKFVAHTERQAKERPWDATNFKLLSESLKDCFLVRKRLLDGGQPTMEDVKTLLSDFMTSDKHTLLDGIWFEVRVDEEPRKKLADFLDVYLNNFIQNKLSGSIQGESSLTRPQNFFTFERHRDLSVGKLEELKSNYGNQFLLSGKLNEGNEFLHIHFLLALEELDYIKINRLGMNSGAYTHGDDPKYEARIAIQPSFSQIIDAELTAQESKGINRQIAQKIEITAMPELVVRNAEDNKKTDFYITKKVDDFYYKSRYLNLSKRSDYYKVFSALYAKLPEGGEISYKDLIAEVKSRLLYKTQNNTDEEMRKFIQRNLTDKSNGLMRYAGIPATEDNGKPLIEVVRGSGIMFNNKTG